MGFRVQIQCLGLWAQSGGVVRGVAGLVSIFLKGFFAVGVVGGFAFYRSIGSEPTEERCL